MENVSIGLCGEAGQGLQTLALMLARILKQSGRFVFATEEVMSRVRGGCNSATVRAAGRRIAAVDDRIDWLVALDARALQHLRRRIGPDTLILGDAALFPGASVAHVPFGKLAAEAGGAIYTNTVAAGVLVGLLDLPVEALQDDLRRQFKSKGDAVVQKNLTAAEQGVRTGQTIRRERGLSALLPSAADAAGDLMIKGADAVALGALAGGCNFVSAYPMSPATGVLTALARHSHAAGIIVEQAEDEIAAINMALGAWYAGARGLASTSGGGFALMTEGVSLAGMTESPLVVHVGQRPGPATGLPTRTEQGDLNLVLHAGHGEFPRIILAPADPVTAFRLAAEAFNLADRFQIPVFLLTDEYLLDSVYCVPDLPATGVAPVPCWIQTPRNYRRYAPAADGVSPRGIPGHGEGLIAVDSDEHDDEGHITEDMDVRTRMADKRLKKMDAIRVAALPPDVIGRDDAQILVVGWGSSYHPLREALERIGRPEIALVHYHQVYPLSPVAADWLRKAERVIVVEQNATGQFEALLKAELGVAAHAHVRQYNGLPFTVDGLVRQLDAVLKS